MIKAFLTIFPEWVWDARREAYWPRHIAEYGNQFGFLIYLFAAIAVIILIISIYRVLRVWFHGKYDQHDQAIVSFIISLIKRAFKNIFSKSFLKRLYYGLGLGITKRESMPKISFLVHSMILLGFLIRDSFLFNFLSYLLLITKKFSLH